MIREKTYLSPCCRSSRMDVFCVVRGLYVGRLWGPCRSVFSSSLFVYISMRAGSRREDMSGWSRNLVTFSPLGVRLKVCLVAVWGTLVRKPFSSRKVRCSLAVVCGMLHKCWMTRVVAVTPLWPSMSEMYNPSLPRFVLSRFVLPRFMV